MKEERKYFKEHFGDFEPSPPLNVWKDLEKGLDKRDTRRKAVFFMQIAAGLLLLITAGWFAWNGLSEKEKAPLAEKQQESVGEEIKNEKSDTPDAKLEEKQEAEPAQKEINPKAVKTPAKEKSKKTPKSKSATSNYNMKLAVAPDEDEAKSDKVRAEKTPLRPVETQVPAEDKKQLENQLDNAPDSELNEKRALAENESSQGSSITIILRPEIHKKEAIAEAQEEPKLNLRKFRRMLDKDLYKYQIDIGKKPSLALGKIKFNQIKLKNDENDQNQL